MFLRDTATAAVGISCLLLMVAHWPIKACSCSESTDEKSFCMAEELVKLTVMEEKKSHGKGDPPRSRVQHYKVHLDKVFKSNMGLIAGRDVDLSTPRKDSSCAMQLSPGSKYLLSANEKYGSLKANGCSWMIQWDSLGQDVIKLLRGEVQPKCT